MHVAEIWRYPVKSMAGESLAAARITSLGIVGDRQVQVYNADELVVTARTHPRLLGHHATLDDSGEPRVDGRPWTDPSRAGRRAADRGAGCADQSRKRSRAALRRATAAGRHRRRDRRVRAVTGGGCGRTS